VFSAINIVDKYKNKIVYTNPNGLGLDKESCDGDSIEDLACTPESTSQEHASVVTSEHEIAHKRERIEELKVSFYCSLAELQGNMQVSSPTSTTLHPFVTLQTILPLTCIIAITSPKLDHK